VPELERHCGGSDCGDCGDFLHLCRKCFQELRDDEMVKYIVIEED